MANIEFKDGSSKHRRRVQRLGSHKRRTSGMMDYLCDHRHSLTANQLKRYRYCHNTLLFRHYPDLEKTKLHEAKHCDIHLMCPMCAIRRASKAVMRYEEKCIQLVENNPNLRLYYVVLTLKNEADLGKCFEHLESATRTLIKRRREAISYRNGKKQLKYASNSVFADVLAGAYSFEIKRGKNSGLWHPHVNLLMLVDKTTPLSKKGIHEEWLSITQDSYITYCNPVYDTRQSFVEIFKYALKFSEMTYADTYTAWETLRKRKLTGSFGEFRGLKIEDADDEIPDELAYEELFYRFNGEKYKKDLRNQEI